MSDKIILLLLLAAGAVFSFIWLLVMRKRLRMKWYAALLIAVIHTVYGVLAVKVFAFLESGFNAESLGNMSLFGAVFLMPLAYWLGAKITKRPYKEVFDIFTPCMIFTLMCARVNCLISGCCVGHMIPGLDGIRYPTREAEIVFYIVLLLILCPKIFKGKSNGNAYLIYMMSYGAFRFIIEFFRESDNGKLFHIAHVWALITLCLGISIYVEKNKKMIKTKKEKNHDQKNK